MNSKHFTACMLAVACLAASARANELSVWTHRGEIKAQLERAAERELKSLFLACSRESSNRVLAFEEMARCSMASEVLKDRFFGGDFHALLAWWRENRHEAVAP
jgi:hypothetical protein